MVIILKSLAKNETDKFVSELLLFTSYIARIKSKTSTIKNLMIAISGKIKDKAEKKWLVENRWIPAVNALKEKYEYPEWNFIEVVNDIRNIKNQLIEKIQSI